MEKRTHLLFALAAIAACRSGSPPPETQLTGAASPRGAVEAFLAAVRAQDLQAMSVAWGTARGPARDVVDRDQLEKRELVMQCFFAHDSFNIRGEAPAQDDTRAFRVELTNGKLTRETIFYAIQGPSERWYVQRADLEPVKDFCRQVPQ